MKSAIYALTLTTALLLFTLTLPAQNQKIALEDIYVNNTFATKTITDINWMNNGKYYTAKVESDIIQFETKSGEKVKTLFEGTKNNLVINDYQLSADENKLLISSNKESIYRRSFRADYYIYDLETAKLKKLSENGKQQYATFSPQGDKVAFVRSNNLFYVELLNNKEIQVTDDGKRNAIINGTTDWVYEEEFAFVKGFAWSNEGDKLAYYRFDESEVRTYNMQKWTGLYPEDYVYKYPKAGEDNSKIQLLIYHLKDKKKVEVDLGPVEDIYVPKMEWTQKNNILSFQVLNRLQNNMEIRNAGAVTGSSQVMLKEGTPGAYIDMNFTDDLIYIDKGTQFIYSSEQSGYKHLYLFDMTGNALTPITKGQWEVDQVVHVDEKSKTVYYTSTEPSHLERHLYSVGFNGRGKTRLTKKEGYHEIDMSNDGQFYIDEFSSPDTPPVYTLHSAKSGKLLKVLEDNKSAATTIGQFKWNPKTFLSINISDSTQKDSITLHGYIIKPADFDPKKTYPLLMYLYGGPGSQRVLKKWYRIEEDLWHKMLAQKGYIVACFDNRGTGGRGAAFKKITYKELGKVETHDQIKIAEKLGRMSYIDETRIGIWGWSYGGFMSTSCLFKGHDVFKAAVAVAPVTSWRYYDNIYTERYMQKPQDNPRGYDDNSPLNFSHLLKGNYLLIHGTGDDNVHIQNAIELQDRLIRQGKQFESFFYPNSAHSLRRPNDRIHLFQKMTEFILNKL